MRELLRHSVVHYHANTNKHLKKYYNSPIFIRGYFLLLYSLCAITQPQCCLLFGHLSHPLSMTSPDSGQCVLRKPVAVASCLAMSTMFVMSLYLVPGRWRRLHRDAPASIRARLAAASIATVCCVFLFNRVTRGGECYGGLAYALGVRSGALWAFAVGLGLTATLYLGSLYDSWTRRETIDLRLTASAVRNLIVGPVTEEIVFRACMLPLLLESRFALGNAIFVSPLFFGVAHLHHLKRHIQEGGMTLRQACFATSLQFAYTTLFGMYTAFVYTRTAHLSAPIACHFFCNYQGLPDFSFLFDDSDERDEWFVGESSSSSSSRMLMRDRKVREKRMYGKKRRSRLTLLAVYIVGIILFTALLFPATNHFDSYFWPARETPSR